MNKCRKVPREYAGGTVVAYGGRRKQVQGSQGGWLLGLEDDTTLRSKALNMLSLRE